MKLTQKGLEQVLAKYREAAGKTRLREAEIDDFMQSVSRTLYGYSAQFPEDTEFEYSIRKRFMRMELRILIPGEKKSLGEYDSQSEERAIEKRLRSMILASTWEKQYFYFRGKNILYFITPPVVSRAVILNPVFRAVLIGLGLGLLCSLLPDRVCSFLSDDIAAPILDIVIKLMSGVMGPIMFISLVTAISTMDSISEFSRLASGIFRKFLIIALFITGLTMAAAIPAFAVRLGEGSSGVSARTIIDLLLSVIPVSLITPFVENDFPQLMVLGIILGIALLLLDKKEGILNGFLMDLRDWMNEVLRLVLKLTPLIPGLTIFRLFIKRDYSDFLSGWKYIAALYLCMAIALAIKILKVKIRCRDLHFSVVMRKIWPLARVSLISGSEMTALKNLYETSEKELGIAPGFYNLWIPLNQAMLAPVAPVYYVLGPCFVAALTGTPVSISFLFILFILTVQLAMAYPGHIPGITILFNVLGLPADYIGLFSAYSVFYKNAASAYGMIFRTLELTEQAYATDNIVIERANAR